MKNLGDDAPHERSSRTGLDWVARKDQQATLDAYERDVVAISRYFFEAFARPDGHAWIEAFAQAERVFPVPFGASIGHAILIAINAVRASRRRTFIFERPGSVVGSFELTDTERYFIRILHDIRRDDRASARAHALFLCEGNDASKVLAAFERLAIITGDVQDPHFN